MVARCGSLEDVGSHLKGPSPLTPGDHKGPPPVNPTTLAPTEALIEAGFDAYWASARGTNIFLDGKSRLEFGCKLSDCRTEGSLDTEDGRFVGVALARPEETLQTILLMTRHDMDV